MFMFTILQSNNLIKMLATYKYCRQRRLLQTSVLKKCLCKAAPESIPEDKAELKRQKSAKLKLTAYFKSEPHLFAVKKYIPEKYFLIKHDTSVLDSLYLVDSNVAKDIVKHVMAEVVDAKKQIICETNAGLGLIALELLDSGVNLVRLYESCPEFRNSLKGFNDLYSGQVELFTKNLFYAYALSYLDKIDNAHRVDELLQGIPKKLWTDEPFLTVIGTMPNIRFIKYLIKTLALQTDFAKYGRIQVFAIMYPRDFTVLTANTKNNLHTYQSWSVLFHLLFEYKLLEKYSRKAFLPWQFKRNVAPRTRYPAKVDVDNMYLVKINFRKELPVENEHMLSLFYFVRQFFGKGTNKVIPTLEKWIPGCGLNMLLPELEHIAKFHENMDIFTQFGSLEPDEILCIFKEVMNHPGYSGSPFLAMVESQLLKSETIESDLVTDNVDLDKESDDKIENV